MKKRFVIYFTLIFSVFLLLPDFVSSNDSDRDRKALRDRNKSYQSRKALKQKKVEEIDYEERDRKAAEVRKEKKEREDYLKKDFEQIALDEIAQARRTYDIKTIQSLEDIAFRQYHRTPDRLIYVYGLVYIYLFNCEYEQYRFNTTKLMYERPKIRKKRAAIAQRALLLVDKLLESSKDNPELLRIKGVFLSCLKENFFSKKHHYLQAEATLKKASKLTEDPTQTEITLASFYLNQPKKYGKNIQAAQLIIKDVLKKNSNWVDAHLILGRIYQLQYEYKKAFDEFKKAFLIEPQNPEVLYYFELGKEDKKRFTKLMDS